MHKMTDDEQELSGAKFTSVPSKGVTVPDATHPRLRKPMCRCTEETHGVFPVKTLHEHFSKGKHKSVSLCSYCGNEIYEYYFTMDRHTMKIYHDCSRQQARNTADSVEEQERIQPISQNFETSDTESSGIGTGYSSTMSIFNGQSDVGQSTKSSLLKSSPPLSESKSMHNDTPNGSQGRKS